MPTTELRQLPRGPVHNTMLGVVRRCPQQYVFKYVNGLRAMSIGKPLRRGLWVHSMLQADALRKGIIERTLLVVPETIDVHGIEEPVEVDAENLEFVLRLESIDTETGEKQVHAFRYPLNAGGMLQILTEHVYEWLPEEAREELTEGSIELPEACKRIVAGYRWAHRDRLDKERVLLVEFEAATDIDGELYHFRIDILLETHDGVVVLRDWKSTQTLPKGQAWKLMESQLHLYPVALAPHLTEMGFTKEIQGIEFDFLRTKLPSKPAVNKSGKLSRAAKEFDARTFLQAAKEAQLDLDDEAYDTNAKYPVSPTVREIVEGCKNEDLFYRRERLPRSKRVTNRLLTENEATISFIDALHEDPEGFSYRVVQRHGAMACDNGCEFTDICIGTLYGLDMSSTIKRDFELWQPDDLHEMDEWAAEQETE